MRILLVEDDPSLRAGICFKLGKEGYTVSSASGVAESLGLLRNNSFHMAILDVNLPDGSGLDILRHVRREMPATHVLILTVKDAETDIVMGYDMGADDYLTKPFSVSVLVGKCGAVARRILPTSRTREISLDASRQMAEVRGVSVPLTRNEVRLLNLLLANTGRVLAKDRLLRELWDTDGDFVDENTLAVNVRRLREKIELDPSRPTLIETVRGVGYRLNGES